MSSLHGYMNVLSPKPTDIDPKDPKGKQKAIHPAETFAEYQARVAREKEEAEKNK